MHEAITCISRAGASVDVVAADFGCRDVLALLLPAGLHPIRLPPLATRKCTSCNQFAMLPSICRLHRLSYVLYRHLCITGRSLPCLTVHSVSHSHTYVFISLAPHLSLYIYVYIYIYIYIYIDQLITRPSALLLLRPVTRACMYIYLYINFSLSPHSPSILPSIQAHIHLMGDRQSHFGHTTASMNCPPSVHVCIGMSDMV